MISVTLRGERTIEYYRDRHHVAVFGFFEDGALFYWAIMWGDKRIWGDGHLTVGDRARIAAKRFRKSPWILTTCAAKSYSM